MYKMSENDYISSMVELYECFKKKYINLYDIIELVKKDLLNGIIDCNMYNYTIQYFSLIDRIENYKDKYIIKNEFIENNIFQSVNIINLSENIFNNIFCNYLEFLEEKNFKYNKNISQSCIICFYRKRQIILSPCNHNILCLFCLNEITKGIKGTMKCPICYINVEKINKIN